MKKLPLVKRQRPQPNLNRHVFFSAARLDTARPSTNSGVASIAWEDETCMAYSYLMLYIYVLFILRQNIFSIAPTSPTTVQCINN